MTSRVPSVRRDATILVVSAVLVAAFKLWLVAGDEIVASATPYDQQRFAEMAKSLIDGKWLGDYDHLTLIREPIYPVWMWFVHSIDLRLHLATESLSILSALAFSAALLSARVPTWLCVATNAAIVLLPYGTYWNTEVRAETLYTPLFLFSLAALVRVFLATSLAGGARNALVAGVALALVWHTRDEAFLVLALIGTFAILHARRTTRTGSSLRRAALRTGSLVALACLPILVLNVAIRLINSSRYGAFVITEPGSSSFLAARRALLRIRADSPRRFVALPAASRERAYAVSPSLAETRPLVEGNVGAKWTKSCCRAVDVCDDLGDAWYFWCLREAASANGHHLSAAEAARYYEAVAREVNAACDDGRVPTRPVFSEHVSPDYGTWVSHVGESVWRVVKVIWHPAPLPAKDGPGLSADVQQLFDAVARRDPARTSFAAVSIRGWAFDLVDPVVRVVLRDAAGRDLAVTSQFVDRPEVAKRYAAKGVGGVPVRIGFEIACDESSRVGGGGGASSIVFVKASGTETPERIVVGRRDWTPYSFGIDSVDGNDSSFRARRRIQSALAYAQVGVALGLSWAAVAAVAILLVVWRRAARASRTSQTSRSSDSAESAIPAIVVLFVVTLIARIALLAVIDASSFPGNQTRYVYPVMALYLAAAALLVRQAWLSWRQSSGVRGEDHLVG